jgi:hypothetical protein
MERTKTAWSEVGERLEALALKLRLHGEEERADQSVPVRDAIDRLGQALRDTVDAVTDAAKDPAVHADVRAAAEAFATALEVTVTETRQAINAKRTTG